MISATSAGAESSHRLDCPTLRVDVRQIVVDGGQQRPADPFGVAGKQLAVLGPLREPSERHGGCRSHRVGRVVAQQADQRSEHDPVVTLPQPARRSLPDPVLQQLAVLGPISGTFRATEVRAGWLVALRSSSAGSLASRLISRSEHDPVAHELPGRSSAVLKPPSSSSGDRDES